MERSQYAKLLELIVGILSPGCDFHVLDAELTPAQET
jgi:hypothetical protein